MAKYINTAVVYDVALNYIKNNGTRHCVCSTQPTTFTQATVTYMLAIKTISSADFTGPAAGDVSGRKITMNQAAAVPVTNSGDAQHIAICDYANSALLLVTTCTLQGLTAGNTVTTPAFKWELTDPT